MVDSGSGKWTDLKWKVKYGAVSGIEVQLEASGKWVEQIRAR